MKVRDIYNVELNANPFTPISKNKNVKPIVGWDTETEKGKCFIIGQYSTDKNKEIFFTKTFDDFIECCFKKEFRKSFNFFYNINYDFQALVKLLPMNNLKELAKWDMTLYKDYEIHNMPGKMFYIQKHNTKLKVVFFDLAQFFMKTKLNNAAIQWLGYGKESLSDEGVDIKNLSAKRYLKDNAYRFILNSYLYRDCEVTQKLGEKLYNLLTDYLNPKAFYSQAYLAQQYFLENLKKKMRLPSKQILDFALRSYQGGRFETIKRGYFEKSFVADIKSAYPFHNVDVPDVSDGIWKSDNEYRSDALISIYNIDTEIYDIKISPAKYQLKNSLLIYPIGKFEGMYVNKKEFETIMNLGFKIKINKAYHYYNDEPYYPYKFLKKFFDLKEKYKAENEPTLAKIPKYIINGFYGKTIQITAYYKFTKKTIKEQEENLYEVFENKGELIRVYKLFKAGLIFNPVVANEITANTRCQLYDNSYKYAKHVIGYQTDSIITDKKLPLNYGDKLGDWEIEKNADKPLIILGSGVYQILDDGGKRRLRGFGRALDLHSLLSNNLYTTEVETGVTRNIKLKRVIKANLSVEDKMDRFNLITNEIRTINLNFDKKRIWDRPFNNCKDVLENQINSEPLNINEI